MSIVKGGNSNYAYAVARVQAKRSKLLPPGDYEKILKMDLSEITRTIEESAYKREVDELSARFAGLELMEAALTVNAERTYSSVRQMLDGEGGALIAMFLDRYIVEDLKAVLRGKNAGASREELLREMLLEDIDTYNIFQPLLADDVQSIDDIIQVLERRGGLAKQLASTLGKVPADAPPSAFEDALDQAFYARMLASLGASRQKGAPLLLRYIRSEIDLRNVLNATRWVASKQEGDFSQYVIPGGTEFSVSKIVSLSRQSELAGITEALQDHAFYEDIREGLEHSVESGRLAYFQAAMWNFHLKQTDRLSHHNPLSITPVIAFVLRKQKEVQTLRALARGKAAGLHEERLRELII